MRCSCHIGLVVMTSILVDSFQPDVDMVLSWYRVMSGEIWIWNLIVYHPPRKWGILMSTILAGTLNCELSTMLSPSKKTKRMLTMTYSWVHWNYYSRYLSSTQLMSDHSLLASSGLFSYVLTWWTLASARINHQHQEMWDARSSTHRFYKKIPPHSYTMWH